MKNKTILLGLNELNFDYIKFYINQGVLPNFKKIFEIQKPIETVSIGGCISNIFLKLGNKP